MIRSALAATPPMLLAATALGQNTLEIIGLRHRTAERGHQLILRASPDNVADLKRALDAIDRPLRRLQISVRFDEALEAVSQDVEARGRISNRGPRVDVRARDYRSNAVERVDQRIQVLEGGHAFISTASTGFDTLARLAGDTMVLEIAQYRDTPDRQQFAATTVSARLGEWVEVGGVAGTRASSRIWLKVEEQRP
jgi:hypothetical protein